MTTLLSHPSTPSGPAPRYTAQDIELSRLDSTSPSILTAPPPYDEAASASFRPTVHLQIETPGKPWFSAPLPPRPDPIPIFPLHPEESSASAASHAPQYISLRPERGSGSCYLVSAADDSPSRRTPLSTTTYRFGPNRPPRIRLFAPGSDPIPPAALATLLFSRDERAQEEADAARPPWDTFTVDSLGLLTRAVAFRTRLGTFQWRYASRKERRRAAAAAAAAADGGENNPEISSLLMLERVIRVARARNIPSSSSSSSSSPATATAGHNTHTHNTHHHDEEIRTVVAHFLRGPAYRTPGSSASSAGNGGRLVVDLSAWAEDDAKAEREMAVVMAATTCLVMLKREVDRRRAQQIAIMAGAAGSS
ncbi:hypothetical protein VTK56DRAFT_3837 [Thermocarpiscus australiensis]